MTYNMEGLLKLSVERYLELVGKDTKLKQVSTPSLPEETKQHKSRAPAPGDPKHAVQCPWCSTKFDPGLPVALQPGASDSRPESVEVQRGALAPHAASILMKLLYAARIARFDLLRSINTLAQQCDKMVHTRWCKTIPSYVLCQLYLREENDWMGRNDMKDLSIALYADADFAGCAQSLSPHQVLICISGETYSVSVSWWSKRQGCVSHSTPEAEIVAADVTLRTMGLPALSIWETLTESSPKLLFHDDNQGMIGVVRSGRNPTMRHLERTHGISITSLHEHFSKDSLCSHVWDHSEDGRGHPHKRFYKSTCLEEGMYVDQSFGTRRPWFEAIGRPSAAHYGCWRYSSSSFSVKDRWGSQISIYWKHPYCHLRCTVRVFSSREKLQELPGMDPIFVVKTPTLFRTRPAGVKLPADCLRSTWI